MIIYNIFSNIWEWLNTQVSKLDFDNFIINLFTKYITGIDEIFKWLLLLLFVIIIILGTISLIKKTFKIFIVLAIIAAAIIIFTNLK